MTATAERVVLWRPQPKQAALIACPVQDVFFGGARGGGKTQGFIGDWLAHAQKYGKAAKGVFFRRSYPRLEEVIRDCDKLFPPLSAHPNRADHTWTFPNGAILELKYADTLADAAQYLSRSWTWMAFEQAEEWPDPGPIDYLWGCLRSADGVPCYRRVNGNPGGVGHHWLRARYIDPAPPMTPFTYRPQPEEHPELAIEAVFIPSFLEDNPALTTADPGYEHRLAAAGGPALYKAWRYGRWDVMVGQVFKEWREDLHVLDGFTPPPFWEYQGACDWGYRNPGWFGLAACGPEHEVIFLKELVFQEQTDQQVGYAVGMLCRQHPYPVPTIAGDEQMWYKTGVGAPTIAEGFQVGLVEAYGDLERAPKLVPATHGRGSRAAKLVVAHQFLAWKAAKDGKVPPWGLPRLRFVRTGCPTAIKTIPALPFAEGMQGQHKEDVDTTAYDHPYDGVTALLMARPPLAVRPETTMPGDLHPGFDQSGRRRASKTKLWEETWRREQEHPVGGYPSEGFRMPRESVPVREDYD